MADQAWLDALAVEVVSTASPTAILDALAVEVVSSAAGQSRLDALAVEIVWTGTGVLRPSVGATQLDYDTGQFESAGDISRQLSLKDGAATPGKLAFVWREVQIQASDFQYDASTRSYYTVTTGPRATNDSVTEQPHLLRNGVGDMSLVTSTSDAQEWSFDGSIVAVHGDITSSGDLFTLRYLTYESLVDAVVLEVDTIDATPTVMTSDGAAVALSNVLRLADDSTVLFRVYIAARRTDANDESAGYVYEAVLDRNTGAATTALVGSVRECFVREDNASWVVAITADTTRGALQVQVTGENAKNVSWRALVLTLPSQG